MTGIIHYSNGEKATLPALTAWELRRTDGSSADSFFAAFPFSPLWEQRLNQAVRFSAWENGQCRFLGIVDEYETVLTREGRTARIYGRGLAGVLMDIQVGQSLFSWVSLREILERYVIPYDVGPVVCSENPRLESYAVDYGTSCWDALRGFCLWAMDIQPRFQADGSLLILPGKGKQLRLGPETPIEEAVKNGCRYGVYRAVVAKYIATGYEQRFENSAAAARGIRAVHRMTVPRKNPRRAGLRSPQQVLEDSGKEASTLRVTVPELFWAEPVDQVTVDLPELGLKGEFLVTETVSALDQDGSRCIVTMRQIT